ncbi:hypothetical protein [Vibrio nigripulchritudo]|uniref:hypothetical protein n=1 Tax=Vibrio nigripulchritudo TaxID=28173 RepID=UPI0003B1E128|nr:hypothetical protein [Vibrio nigripulchritudo]CCN69780.1 conserved hypothetical protein [Vibrio nigripulchritudo SFn118]
MLINLGFSNIIHIFVMPKPDDMSTSPFQGFTTSIFSDEYYSSLAKVVSMPTNAVEVYMNRDEVIQFRSNIGTSSVILLDSEVLSERIGFFKHYPFVVITCLNEELDIVRSLQLDFDYPPIIAGVDKELDINLDDFNTYLLDEIIISRMQEVLKRGLFPQDLKEYIENRKPRDTSEEIVNVISRTHGVTNPNEKVFLSLGYDFKEIKPLVGGPEKQSFIDTIVNSYRDLKYHISGHREDRKIDIIVYSPSIYSHLYKFKSNFWNQISRRLKNKRAREFVMNGIFKNPSYSGINIQFDKKSDIENLMDNEVIKPMLAIRQFELAYTSLAISSLAVSNLCPAIRLPNSINFHNGLLNDLESLSKSTTPKSLKNFDRKYKDLTNKLLDEIGEELVELIRENESVALCTDVPLEWLTVDRIPLLFTHEISKIHTTTGDQLLKLSMNFSSFSLEQDDLKKITVIRSFRDNDPIKPILEQSLRHYIGIDNEIELEVIDVQDKNQLFDALSKVKTQILVFDCHGNHGGSEEHGWLQIGTDQVNTWELPVVVPPIIILSACLTSAIAGSHASVANGLLEKGAVTVLGTLLPVDATKSAVFVGRIAYRMTGYLKALRSIGVDSLTWRKFISDFFKMSFCTDILSILRDQYNWFNEKEYKDIHIKANLAINMNNKKWFDVLVELISEKANQPIEDVNSVIQEIGFLETMNYSQIGRPENIVIQLRNLQEKNSVL